MTTTTAAKKKIHAAAKIWGSRRLIPTREAHQRRNEFNRMPDCDAQLVDTGVLWWPDLKQRGRGCRVFLDDKTGTRWIRQPWYRTLFHHPRRNYKYTALDASVMTGAPGSSEIIVKKTTLRAMTDASGETTNYYDGCDLRWGSYNYRDRGIRHVFADVLPVALYLKCIGE